MIKESGVTRNVCTNRNIQRHSSRRAEGHILDPRRIHLPGR